MNVYNTKVLELSEIESCCDLKSDSTQPIRNAGGVDGAVTHGEIVALLCHIVEFRSEETHDHITRVTGLSYQIARSAGYPMEYCNTIKLAASLHDIGKVGIPDSILKKPGALTPAEMDIMKQHTTYGEQMLSESSNHVILTGAVIAGSHHEKWDGSGYPLKLSGTNIPLEGRIVAIADVFDAISSERCYKAPWTMAESLTYIKRQSGNHFDPDLVIAFFKGLRQDINEF